MTRLTTTGVRALTLAIAVAAGGWPAHAQEPSLATVLERAGDYVAGFQRQLSGVVAEETYVQDVREPIATGTVPRAPMRTGPMHRELKSDLLLVKPERADRWIQFRDVFEVDGHPVRDRSERLMKLFVEPTASTADQAEHIVTESSRYNIGNVVRTINVPLFALLILDPERQAHFKFARTGSGAPAIAGDLKVDDGVWVVRYEETGRGTMITTTFGRDLPSRGRFWIDPLTGRVLMSELVAEDTLVAGTVVVKYQPDVLADLLVPVAMRERYLERRNNARIDGAATYGKFRQFQVKVDEKIAPIKDRD
jgi:hypothetical protein